MEGKDRKNRKSDKKIRKGSKKNRKDSRISRRNFLKISGSVAAIAGGGGLGLFGYAAGKDPDSYTGCESFQGAAQDFNRKRY
ncbi:MAG: twin-arginine translocation signal domain-containing protein, partial [Bacteroidales bacterium]|nr:twin-arginine translocation signal domain-containing protein [Candidatus Latescibacterota bacterium]